MTAKEREYLDTLYERMSSGEAFASLVKGSTKEPLNLVSELKSSPFPLVLCAFLEAGEYQSSYTIPFIHYTPAQHTRVIQIHTAYNDKLPESIVVVSQNGFNGAVCGLNHWWDGIQYAKFHLGTFKLEYAHYEVTSNMFKGRRFGIGKIPTYSHFHDNKWSHSFVCDTLKVDAIPI